MSTSTPPLPLPFLDHFANEKDLLAHAGQLLDSLGHSGMSDARSAMMCLSECASMNIALHQGGIPEGLMSPKAMEVLSRLVVANKAADGVVNHAAIAAVIFMATAAVDQRNRVVQAMSQVPQQVQ